MFFILYILIGAIAGTLSGLFGIGGGIIVVPTLSWLFLAERYTLPGSAIQSAMATSLAIMILTLFSSVISHMRQKTLRWDLFLPMSVWLMLGALIGVSATQFISANALRMDFSLILLITAIRVVLVSKRRRLLNEDNSSLKIAKSYLSCVALFAGGLAGLLGISGGVVMGPFFYRCGLVLAEASGTAAMCGFTIGISATIGYLLLGLWHTGTFGAGYVYWPAFFCIVLASILFAPFGAKLATLIPSRLSKLLFSLLLFSVAVAMFFSRE